MFLLMFYHPFAQTQYASLPLAITKHDVDLGPSSFVHTLSTIVFFLNVFNMYFCLFGHLPNPVHRMLCFVPTRCLLGLLAGRHVMSFCLITYEAVY